MNCTTCKNCQPKANDQLQQAWDERTRFYAEGDKLHAEGDKLWAEGQLVFILAVLEVHGNVAITWDGNSCVVEGVEYK